MGNTEANGLIPSRPDCGQIPGSKLRQARQEAEAIRRLLEKTAMNIVQIGLRLRLVHDVLGREHFQQWLRQEFQWNQSVASNYMRAAERFSELDCLSHFQPSALYVLARRKAPEAARLEAIDRARSGELITKSQAERLVQKHSSAAPAGPRRIAAVRNALRRALKQLRELDLESLDSPAGAELFAMVQQLQSALQKTPTRSTRKPR